MRRSIIVCFWTFVTGLLASYVVGICGGSIFGSLHFFFVGWVLFSFLSVFLTCAIGVVEHPRLVRKVLLAMTGIVVALIAMPALP